MGVGGGKLQWAEFSHTGKLASTSLRFLLLNGSGALCCLLHLHCDKHLLQELLGGG